MSDSVIKVENIGKKYIIGHQKQERYTALRDVITEKFKSFGRKLLIPVSEVIENQEEFEEFGALKDVSKVAFYEKRHKREVNRKLVIAHIMDKKALLVAQDLGIEVYSSAYDVMSDV